MRRSSSPGQTVILLGPLAMIGQQSMIGGPALGSAFSARLDAAMRREFRCRRNDEEELEFQTGQKAILLGLPAIIGSKARSLGLHLTMLFQHASTFAVGHVGEAVCVTPEQVQRARVDLPAPQPSC